MIMRWIFPILIMVISFGAALDSLGTLTSDRVMCGEVVMRPRDTCRETTWRSGSVSEQSRDFAEQRAYNHREARIYLVGGAVVGAGLAAYLVARTRGERRRRRAWQTNPGETDWPPP